MAKLEDLKRGATVKGILPDCLVTVVDVKWYGSAGVELTYKDPPGKPSVVLLYRDREPTLEIGETGRPWSFDGDGKLFRLVSEAHRINLAHLLIRCSPSTPRWSIRCRIRSLPFTARCCRANRYVSPGG
jgi:hypothetical protein